MFEIQNQVAGGLMEEVRSDQGDVLACFSKARGQVWLEQRVKGMMEGRRLDHK